jgi:hypothetical protein
MDTTQQNFMMREISAGQPYAPNAGFMGNDLTNLAADLQAPTYEFDKQVRKRIY